MKFALSPACLNATDHLRREKVLAGKLSQLIQDLDDYTALPESALAGEIQNSLLRLIFTCCHLAIPRESRWL